MQPSEANVAVLCENLYQELELWHPLLRVREAGASVYTVGGDAGTIYSSRLGYPVLSDFSSAEVNADDFDALIVPGGQSPERMRRNAHTLDFVRKIDEQGKPLAVICHAGWVLASAEVARGRRLTCVPYIKDDLIHAGADWVDEPLVIDRNLITSRNPDDAPIWAEAIVKAIEEMPSRASKVDLGVPQSSPFYTVVTPLLPRPTAPGSANYRTMPIPAGV